MAYQAESGMAALGHTLIEKQPRHVVLLGVAVELAFKSNREREQYRQTLRFKRCILQSDTSQRRSGRVG